MTNVLVIDDDMDILLLIKLILEKNGMIATISDEPLAIDMLIREIHPNLILMDINMDPHDGRIICKRLKVIAPNLPVLLFSANKISESSLVECGADGFLAKPFIADQLLNKINSMMA